MREQRYLKIKDWVTKSEKRLKAVKLIYEYLPYAIGYYYLAAAFFLFFTGNLKIIRFTAVPAMLFLLVTAFRCIVSTKRPYEVYNITPIMKKDKIGKSMPSRHTACAFAIAMAFMHLNVIAGLLMMILAAAVGLSRVLCGVHFIKDVIAGAIVAVIFDFLGNAFLSLLYDMFVKGLEHSLSALF